MNLPNLIIAGAPKAGSSSLFHWLNAHPEVYGTPFKETFYFIDEDSSLFQEQANFNVHGLDKYASFFPNCPNDAKVILEATPHYIYQKTALDFFAKCETQPHVVFILRKPSKRLFSSFNFAQNYLDSLDRSLTFENVTNLLLDETGKLVQDLEYPADSFFYVWLKDQLPNNCYYNFIAPWVKSFPQEKIHIILFEEMVSNPRKILIRLANNLGIDSDFYNEFSFEKRNSTVSIKNKYLHKSITKFAYFLQSTGIKTILDKYKIMKLIKSSYIKINSSRTRPAPTEALNRLDDYFRPHNQKLAEVFDLDLSPWN